MFRATTGSDNSDVGVLRCQDMFCAYRVQTCEDFCMVSNRLPNRCLHLIGIFASSDRVKGALRNCFFYITQAYGSNCVLFKGAMCLVGVVKGGRILIESSALSDDSGRLILCFNFRLFRITFRVKEKNGRC